MLILGLLLLSFGTAIGLAANARRVRPLSSQRQTPPLSDSYLSTQREVASVVVPQVSERPNIVSRFFSEIGRFFRWLFGIEEPTLSPAPDVETPVSSSRPPSSQQLATHRQVLTTFTDVNSQMSYLNNTVLSQATREALTEFNRENNNLDLRCTGISPNAFNQQLGLVFTTVGLSDSYPIRIDLSDTELIGKDKKQIKRILAQRVQEYKTHFAMQIDVWRRARIPQTSINPAERRNNSFVVGVCIPTVPGRNIRQVEGSYVGIINTLGRGENSLICMQNPAVWNSLRGDGMPSANDTTISQIESTVSIGLERAVERNCTDMYFPILGHGNRNGTIQATDGELEYERIIGLIGERLRANPNTVLRTFHFVIDSCRSDLQRRQLEIAIRRHLSSIPNLTIHVTASSDENGYSCTTGSHYGYSSFVNPRISSNSGFAANLFSFIRQVNPNISDAAALQWVDMNLSWESPTRQNAQGYIYTTGSGQPGQFNGSQFTRRDTISEDPNGNQLTTAA